MNCIFEAQISDPSFYQLIPIKVEDISNLLIPFFRQLTAYQ